MPRSDAQPAAATSRGEALTERALSAAERLLALDGWGKLTPKAVAREAEMSQRAVQSRFSTRSDVAAALVGRLGPPLVEQLASLLAAAGQIGEPARPADLSRALDQLAGPDPASVAAVELVMVSRFDPTLRSAVEAVLGHTVRGWCTPARGSVPAALAARRAYLLAIGLGLVMAGPTAPSGLRLDSEAARLVSALAAGTRPVTLPRAEAAHLRVRPVLAPDDPALEALLTATLDEVGARGFDDATTAGISRAAGHSEGLLFSRYQSKLELFLDACEVQRRPGFEANEAFLSRLTASRGRGVAEAVLIREFMHPDAEGPRTLTLEQVRVAWHDTRLRDSLTRQAEEFVNSLRESPTGVPAGRDPVAYFHLATAIGLGLVLLPRLDPEAWRLPYDVMTVPLEGE